MLSRCPRPYASIPYASPYDTIFAFERCSIVTAVGSTSKTRAAVALWMSWPDSNAEMSPGSSARCAMHRSSIWL
jgi:hypothetical protein